MSYLIQHICITSAFYSVLICLLRHHYVKGVGKRVLWKGYVLQAPNKGIANLAEGWSYVIMGED